MRPAAQAPGARQAGAPLHRDRQQTGDAELAAEEQLRRLDVLVGQPHPRLNWDAAIRLPLLVAMQELGANLATLRRSAAQVALDVPDVTDLVAAADPAVQRRDEEVVEDEHGERLGARVQAMLLYVVADQPDAIRLRGLLHDLRAAVELETPPEAKRHRGLQDFAAVEVPKVAPARRQHDVGPGACGPHDVDKPLDERLRQELPILADRMAIAPRRGPDLQDDLLLRLHVGAVVASNEERLHVVIAQEEGCATVASHPDVQHAVHIQEDQRVRAIVPAGGRHTAAMPLGRRAWGATCRNS
mmetsp:Transcript_76496/g.222181  ORF Transcript_76496/g.222181 Transcript_76496/m.222181 type:complete len:300 (+) Transcript_76496:260-1159(+)